MIENGLIVLVSFIVVLTSMIILANYSVEGKGSILVRWIQWSLIMLVIFIIVLPSSNNSILSK